MNHVQKSLRISGVLVCIVTGLIVNAQELASPSDQAAVKLAKELTSHGVELFVQGNGNELAAQYVDDAEIVMTTLEPYGAPTIQITRGHEKINQLYQVAPKLGQMSPVNDVHYARFITPEILHISGIFMITDQGETKRYPFTQIRRKEGDKWKIVSLELQVKK
jgi:hypothetical protein